MGQQSQGEQGADLLLLWKTGYMENPYDSMLQMFAMVSMRQN